MKISFLTTLRFKITLFITTLLLVTATLFTLLTVQTMNSLMKRAEALSKSIAAVAPYSILAGDLLAIDNISWRVKEANEDIQYAAVTNSRFEILTHTDMSKIGQVFSRSVADAITETKDGTRIYQIKDEADSFEIQAPMTFNNKQIGHNRNKQVIPARCQIGNSEAHRCRNGRYHAPRPGLHPCALVIYYKADQGAFTGRQ